MKKASVTAKQYTSNIQAGTGSAQSYAEAQKANNAALKSVSVGAGIASKAVKLLSATMNTLIFTAVFTAISNGIQWVSDQISDYIHRNEIAIEKAEELLNTFNSELDDITSKQSTLEGLELEFNKLSKGVDDYGKNVSLTADEYERYQDIVETIVGVNPSLITGWDEEGNILARKNGLLEDSIQLLKDEYQQKIKNMALPDNIGTAIDGVVGRYNTAKEKFHNVAIPNSLAFSGVKINADGNEEYGYVNQIPQYIEDVIGVEFKNEGIDNYILNNAEAVFNNLDKIKERAAETKDGWKGLTDSQIIDLMDYFRELRLVYNDMNAAATSANSTLQYVAMAEDSYAGLTDKQKVFISDYINGIKITAETTEQEKDAIRKSIISITNELANHPDASQLFEDLYTLPKDELPADEYIAKYKQLVEDIIKALDGEDGTGLSEEQEIEIRARFNIVDDENSVNTMKEELKDKVQGDLGTLSLEDLKIAYEKIDFGSGIISLEELIVKIEEYKKSLQEVKNEVDSLTDAIKAAESAFELFNEVEKDFNSTGAVSAENIQKILNKFPELEDELYEYIMGMRTGASVMDLLKAKSDDMATMSVEAFKKMYLSSNSASKNIVADHKNAFDYVAKGWDATKSVMANVNSQIIDANGNVCTTFAEQWKTACEAVGTNMQALASGFASFMLGEGYSDGKGVYKKDVSTNPAYKEGFYSKTYYDTSGAGTNLTEAKTIELYGKNYTEAQYQSVFEAQKEQRADILANNAEIERRQKEFEERMKQFAVTSDDKSGSDKNEALDNYLKDAENRYKIHQDETKYIEELQWAHDNLTKDEKERLDIIGKINEAYRDLADNRIKDLEHQIDLTKELKGENADVTAQLNEIQRVAKEEANRLRAMGYDNNSNEIQDLQKTWLDAENQKQDFYSKQHENRIRDIEHARDLWLEENPFGDITSYYKQLQEEYHREAERLRALDPEKYKEEIQELQQSWIDAQNEIADWSLSNSERWIDERNKYNDWAEYGDNEVAAWKRVLDRFKKEFPNELDKIAEIEENYFNAQKDQLDKSLDNIDNYIDARNHYNDWDAWGDSEINAVKRQINILDNAYKQKLLSLEEYTEKVEEYNQQLYSVAKDDLIEKIEDMIEDYGDLRDKEREALDFEVSQYSSLHTLLQSYYNIVNSITDAQHEINKELYASMTMYEYLNEETRKLLFNQEDYNILSEKLLDIQNEADLLQKQYNDDILSSSKENIEEITSQYQMQYETLMKSYEIAKADLEIAKKKQKLNNVLNERNVRMFIDGAWQWVANTQDVIDAQNELAEAELEKKQKETLLSQTETLNDLQKTQNDITTQINYIDSDLEKVREQWDKMQEQLNGESAEVIEVLTEIADVDSPLLQKIIEETGGTIKSFATSVSDVISTMKTVISESKSGNSSGNKTVSGGSVSSGGITYSPDAMKEVAYKNTDYAQGIYDALAKGDINAALAANKLRNDKIDFLGSSEQKWTDSDIKNMAKQKLATGTRNTKAGWTALGEVEDEMFIDNNGHLIPINQPTFANIGAGGTVFNQAQMINLKDWWDLSNFKAPDYSSLINKNMRQNMVTNNDYSVIINGMTVDSGSKDGQVLINALRRYVGNH